MINDFFLEILGKIEEEKIFYLVNNIIYNITFPLELVIFIKFVDTREENRRGNRKMNSLIINYLCWNILRHS